MDKQALQPKPIWSIAPASLALFEVQHSIYFLAAHIPGETNILTDAGSRRWHSTHYTDLLTYRISGLRSGHGAKRLQESLQALGAILRAGALATTSRVHDNRHWEQWSSWCQYMNFDPWLPKHDTRHNSSQLGAFAVFLW